MDEYKERLMNDAIEKINTWCKENTPIGGIKVSWEHGYYLITKENGIEFKEIITNTYSNINDHPKSMYYIIFKWKKLKKIIKKTVRNKNKKNKLKEKEIKYLEHFEV